MEGRTYTYIFENKGGGSGGDGGTPIAPTPNPPQPEPQPQPDNKQSSTSAVTMGLVAWSKVKPFIYSAVTHELSQVSLASGAREQSQRTQEVWSLAQKASGIVESTIVGTVLAGGNPLGAAIGLSVGLLSTGIQYAQAYDTLNTQYSVENVSLSIQRRRAATTNSRSSQ